MEKRSIIPGLIAYNIIIWIFCLIPMLLAHVAFWKMFIGIYGFMLVYFIAGGLMTRGLLIIWFVNWLKEFPRFKKDT